MTPDDIAKARALIAAATPGEWWVDVQPWGSRTLVDGRSYRTLMDGRGYHFGQIDDGGNAAFIAAARTGWPAALDQIERLRGEVRDLQNELAAASADRDAFRDLLVRARGNVIGFGSAELRSEIDDNVAARGKPNHARLDELERRIGTLVGCVAANEDDANRALAEFGRRLALCERKASGHG